MCGPCGKDNTTLFFGNDWLPYTFPTQHKLSKLSSHFSELDREGTRVAVFAFLLILNTFTNSDRCSPSKMMQSNSFFAGGAGKRCLTSTTSVILLDFLSVISSATAPVLVRPRESVDADGQVVPILLSHLPSSYVALKRTRICLEPTDFHKSLSKRKDCASGVVVHSWNSRTVKVMSIDFRCG